jgi:putative nucleotidyltransferase with HDIG domain
VEVASSDEFADLAASFNSMADQLEGRFAVLAAGRRIDEIALAAFDRDQIVEAFLEGCRRVFRDRRLAVVRADEADRWRVWAAIDPAGTGGRIAAAPEAHRVRACAEAEPTVTTLLADRGALGDLTHAGFEAADLPVTLVPLRIAGGIVGTLALGGRQGRPPDDRALADALTLVGHTSLGVNGAQLVTDLEDMSWGTIRAMARAVDAKSPWTAGHSERVTVLAIALGRQLGLSEAELLLIERGGLLHDLGKIGVPAAVLDYPGGLSDEQFGIMKRHPVIGAEILEPIVAFRPILPLVRSHHERWDGSGYPDGLAGTDIHPLARILAVADVFDAMVSERPYRGAMDVQLVHSIICEGVGTGFDPEPVAALTAVLERGWAHSEATLETLAHV